MALSRCPPAPTPGAAVPTTTRGKAMTENASPTVPATPSARRRRRAGVRDRIVELTRIRAGELEPNPANWRRHPERQRAALRGLLRQIGYADALLARRDGQSLVLVDGHLRQSLD